MSHTETGVMFVPVVLAGAGLLVVWAGAGLINLINFFPESARSRKEVPPEEPLQPRNDLESAEQDYHAMLQRLGVTDRWFRHAWPLTQISLMWSGPAGSLTSAIPAALRVASGELSQNGAGNFSCGCLADVGLAPGLMWHITSRVAETEPSVFTGDYGDQTRPGAWRSVRMPDSLERVAILLQGTRHTTAETLSLYLLDVADRLERGDADGVKHDDDSGWAFRTVTGEANERKE